MFSTKTWKNQTLTKTPTTKYDFRNSILCPPLRECAENRHFLTFKNFNMGLSLPTHKRQYVVTWIFLSLYVMLDETQFMGTFISPFTVALALFAVWGWIKIYRQGNLAFIITSVPVVIWHLGLAPFYPVLLGTIILYFLLRKL